MCKESSKKNEEKSGTLKATTRDTEQRLGHKPQKVELIPVLEWKFHPPGEQKEKSDDSKISPDIVNTSPQKDDESFHEEGSIITLHRTDSDQPDSGISSPVRSLSTSSNSKQSYSDEDQEEKNISAFPQENSEQANEGISSPARSLSTSSASETKYYQLTFIDKEFSDLLEVDSESNWEEIDEDIRIGSRSTSPREPISLDESAVQGSDNGLDGEENSDSISEELSGLSEVDFESNWEEIDKDIKILTSSQRLNPSFKLNQYTEIAPEATEENCLNSRKGYIGHLLLSGLPPFPTPEFHPVIQQLINIRQEIQQSGENFSQKPLLDKTVNNLIPGDENIVKADSSKTTEVCQHQWINKDSQANNKKTNIAASCFLVLAALSATTALSLGLYEGHFGIVECILVIIAIVSVCTATLIKSYSKVKSYLGETKSNPIASLQISLN